MSERRLLGEILVEQGQVDPRDVALVLQAPAGEEGKLASELHRLGVASERALAQGLAEQLGHPAVVLSESSLDLTALALVPRVVAEQHLVLPIAVDVDALTVAVVDVNAHGRRREIFDHIEMASGRRVVAYVAVEAVLVEGIALAYEQRRLGETVLVGSGDRPVGTSLVAPLAIVRPHVRVPRDDILAEPATSGAFRAPVVHGTSARPVVFIVDDDDAIRALLARVLKSDGYDCVEAGDGRVTLEVLRTLRPALILLDAMLPGVQGYDVCQLVKGSPAFAGTPVVMVSAVMKDFEHARAFQEVLGADAFVEKPFDVHYLRQVVARLLGRALPRNELGPEWEKKVAALRAEAHQHWSVGALDDAEAALKRWRALDPFDADLYLLAGNIAQRRGDASGAMRAWERAAAFDAHLFAAFKNLAVVYGELGFLRRAHLAWYRAYELAPDPETRRRIEEHLARS